MINNERLAHNQFLISTYQKSTRGGTGNLSDSVSKPIWIRRCWNVTSKKKAAATEVTSCWAAVVHHVDLWYHTPLHRLLLRCQRPPHWAGKQRDQSQWKREGSVAELNTGVRSGTLAVISRDVPQRQPYIPSNSGYNPRWNECRDLQTVII